MKKDKTNKKRNSKNLLPAETQARIKVFTDRNKLTFFVILTIVFTVAAAALIVLSIFAALYYTGIIQSAGIPMMWLAGIIVVAVLIVSVVISSIVSRFFLDPVKELAAIMHLVEEGDLTVRMPEQPKRSPLRGVSQRFNTMIDELSANELFRRDFINTFSHEFKTPIVSIRGFAKQIVEDESLSEVEKSEYAKIILDESERLAGMSTNILLLSKFETQNMITDATWFSLDEQIRHSILLLEKQWSKKNINLDIDMDEISYYSNEEMMSHIWINLFSNAIKFSDDNGDISIVLKDRGDNIEFRVADNGCGMDDQTVKRVFEKFYQGDSSHSREGNGLGLAICARIVSLCDGKIEVQSALNVGTTFIVTLPKIQK